MHLLSWARIYGSRIFASSNRAPLTRFSVLNEIFRKDCAISKIENATVVRFWKVNFTVLALRMTLCFAFFTVLAKFASQKAKVCEGFSIMMCKKSTDRNMIMPKSNKNHCSVVRNHRVDGNLTWSLKREKSNRSVVVLFENKKELKSGMWKRHTGGWKRHTHTHTCAWLAHDFGGERDTIIHTSDLRMTFGVKETHTYTHTHSHQVKPMCNLRL